MPTTLTVTAKGQVTLRKDLLKHLGARPGDKLRIELLQHARLQLRALPKRPVSSLFGMLEKPDAKSLSTKEIAEITAAGWAGER